ncbi:type I-E CRISPR-associated endoribonuclease Cas2e [Roseibium sp. RKSG952]|uniref:type I-E CRISPR-associated endoribonuclease Cas2e n=1 Tax=Roseibium sp. RKSG952 TaxID=2529384 RepID=UPI0034D00123
MPELSPGVYASSNLSRGIRDRLWEVVSDWHSQLRRGSVSMIYEDKNQPSGLMVESVGAPAREIVDFDGFYVSLKRN